MKKGIIFLLLVLLPFLAFAEGTEYFGELGGDIWIIQEDGVEVLDDYVDVFVFLDIQKSEWNNFDPYESGLYGVGLMFRFYRTGNIPGEFAITYNSKYDLRLDNWVFIYNSYNKAFLLGGDGYIGDAAYFERQPDGTYMIASRIALDEGWVKWWTNPPDGTYKLAVFEFNYGDNLKFDLPPELFLKLQEVYNTYIGENNDSASRSYEFLVY